ncbi:MAG: MazG family protein [Myxococcota bacterium]|jgi:MazG family protein
MKAYLVEETYEVCEAIESGEPAAVCDELGDLLFLVVFIAQIAAEKGEFNLEDVVAGISEKMERRHPHVFGDATLTAEEAAAFWEAEKRREKGDRGPFDGWPSALPALHKARRVGEKMAGFGFDWPDHTGAMDKVHEEVGELTEAIAAGESPAVRDELGDVLFALVSLARKLGLDAEDALRRTLDKAIRRFTFMKRGVEASGKTLDEVSLETMEAGWQEAKRTQG